MSLLMSMCSAFSRKAGKLINKKKEFGMRRGMSIELDQRRAISAASESDENEAHNRPHTNDAPENRGIDNGLAAGETLGGAEHEVLARICGRKAT